MNKFQKITGLAASMAAMTLSLASCVADAPFGDGGDGVLKMRMVINSDVTRAESDIDDLRSNCVVYVSSTKGLLHKFNGLENVPDELKLKSGKYVAEAWTGDSVSASWDKKFYRGYEPFEINGGLTQVVLNCRIANVLASVNPATVDPELMKDWTIEVGNSRASLVFDAENMDYAKAYFMMPTDKEASEVAGVAVKESVLDYTIAGTNSEGKDFKVEGKIENVQSAHEYIFNISYNPDYAQIGGAYLTVTIDDRETLIEDEVEIFAAPALSGADFDLSKQIVGASGEFTEKVVKISGFSGLKSVMLSTDDREAFRLPGASLDLFNITESALPAVKTSGLDWEYIFNEEKDLGILYITMSADFLNALPERDKEYSIAIAATDANGKTSEATVRVAVGEGAVVVEDPITIPVQDELDMLAVGSRKLVIPVTINSDEVSNPRLTYREAGTSVWTEVPLSTVDNVRGKRAAGKIVNVTLSGLTPATRYEIRSVCDGVDGGEPFEGESIFMTTESIFTIPNASMEEWSSFTVEDDVSKEFGQKTNSKVLLPGAGGCRTFWDSGNHGSATMSKTLTQSSTKMFSSGSVSAELKSQFVGLGSIGKFAAGNLFTGAYCKTDGTDGVLRFGRQYDGSHPSALKVRVNYRPGKGVAKKGADSKYIAEGAEDIGQIYVALSTEPVMIETKNSKQLFNKDADCIIAYGTKDFVGSFGPEGQLEELTIPVEYYAKAKTTRPLYLIIVCSASKYGDYFSGGEGSTMYVDDFELIYE